MACTYNPSAVELQTSRSFGLLANKAVWLNSRLERERDPDHKIR